MGTAIVVESIVIVALIIYLIRFRQKNKKRETQFTNLCQEFERVESNIIRLTMQIRERENIQKNSQSEIEQLSNENARILTDLKHTEIQKQNLSDRIEQLSHQIDQLAKSNMGKDKQLEKAREWWKTTKEQIRQLDMLYQKNLALSEKVTSLSEYIKNPPASFPKIASAVADLQTVQLDETEKWLISKPHPAMSSAEAVRNAKLFAKEQMEIRKLAEYKLDYLFALYPQLEDVLEANFNEIIEQPPDYIAETDPAKEYMSRDEWRALSPSERNQLALDNYIKRRKSKWQIGRDYELSIGYRFEMEGYSVDYVGSFDKFEDLGRDLICKKNNKTVIVQCKYWSKNKQIHENHINQLFGTSLVYSITNNIPANSVESMLVTNIKLTSVAKQFAQMLKVKVMEDVEFEEFPRIKCNINKDEYGLRTKIYHLPMDQQYDRVKIDGPGEFFAWTVKEAEAAGFRRAFKHYKQQ